MTVFKIFLSSSIKRTLVAVAASFCSTFIDPYTSLAADRGVVMGTDIIFATGFQIPSKHYQSYASGIKEGLPTESSLLFMEDKNTFDDTKTIEQSSEELTRSVQEISAARRGKRNLVLVGTTTTTTTTTICLLRCIHLFSSRTN